ncbi:MAG TPA: flagellar motor protein MotB [Bryobacteraceae bacterium]|nr:flagellar motor protein MotB [Bryobacteraceae bacterium]
MSRPVRRQREDPPANHERWLVSYSDFITLMFAFFVVLFATSQSDIAKTRAVSEAVENALRDEKFGAKLKYVLGGSVSQTNPTGNASLSGLRGRHPKSDPSEKLAELTPSFKRLTRELEDDIKAGRIQINMEPRGLVISMKEGAFFNSGDDAVLKERWASIGKLANVVKAVPNPVRLEGHTDSRPVHNGRFRSNWELSAARSIAVLEILRDQFGIQEGRMAVVGYSDTLATDSNDTEEGRARNRRVDMTILNEAASIGESTKRLLERR